ncbi:hypothetical protein HK100_012057 [Physocladia obscura]|uniref:Uncharacterized protein n=1 Tax=Physocladia obscura TaxID=109957 RepID=A0AAD5T2X2_9FUNG|nr:hypothetical protein HK100_012057 [Physocladia obscura]
MSPTRNEELPPPTNSKVMILKLRVAQKAVVSQISQVQHDPQHFDVFLSSQGQQASTAALVNNYLHARYLKVWKDTREMSGNIFEAMAKGNINSSVVTPGC